MNPDVLLMDEAFSALDVLTGETLRDDMLELWDESRISTKGILIVSHNIEEAVMMADRIIVFASDPGRIRSQVQIGLPRPRNPDSAEVRALIDEVYALMTSRPAHGAPTPRQQGLGYRFPQTEVERMEACWTCWPRRRSTAAPTCPSWPRKPRSRTTTCCRPARRWACSAWPRSTGATSS